MFVPPLHTFQHFDPRSRRTAVGLRHSISVLERYARHAAVSQPKACFEASEVQHTQHTQTLRAWMGWVRDHAEKHLNKHLDHLRQAGQVRQENGGSQGAGASWSPNKPPYDVKLPIYPVSYSEEEKTAQREAGKLAVILVSACSTLSHDEFHPRLQHCTCTVTGHPAQARSWLRTSKMLLARRGMFWTSQEGCIASVMLSEALAKLSC